MKKKLKNNILNITLPTKWSDLTPSQVARVAACLSSNGDRVEQLILLAADLADLKIRDTIVHSDGSTAYTFYHRDRGNLLFTSEHVLSIVEALSWVDGEISPMAAPELDGCKTPDSRLYGVTVEQYITADAAYNHYVETRDMDALRMCAAALYPRHLFTSDSVRAEARRMARLDGQLSGVFLWFTGAKKFLADKFPYIFSSGGGGEPISGAEIMLSLLSSVNGGDVTKNEQLKSSELHEVFYELNMKIKNSKNNG